MFFEIENTPEHIKRARRRTVVRTESPKEECPRLLLAPFSRPPQVVFDNVLIGSSCERTLEVFNPSKQIQQITLGKALPPGLVIQLPGEWLVLEPETSYYLTMRWTPSQPTALRETIRFTNENRGRYDIVVVLKSAMIVQGKGKPKQPKGFKISPGKKTIKSGKRSPVAIYKKKSEIIYKATTNTKTVTKATYSNSSRQSNKENISAFDHSIEPQNVKCPFDSPTSMDFNFDTSEIFSNMRKTETIFHNTYDTHTVLQSNILKPSNKQNCDMSASDLFDNLTFTPLKTVSAKNEKLEKGPNIILSLDSDSEFENSLTLKSNKENETHSIVCITSAQPHQWDEKLETQYMEPVQSKKIPNTSSPKEWNSLNFSMNTEISRISDLSFAPQRFSTERKMKCNDIQYIYEDPNLKLNSDTYTKESPKSTHDFYTHHATEVRPPHFFTKEQPKICRQSLFRESQQIRDCFLNPDSNAWNRDRGARAEIRSPPRSITPPLQSIPEESTYLYETQTLDKNDKQNTFTLPMNRTFDKDRSSLSSSTIKTWSKKSIKAEPELWKMPELPTRKAKPKPSINSKDSISGKLSSTFDQNKSISQNVTLNQVGNVYSQASTVDPFLSASYFYDEEAVHRFEEEFKKWLNYILTPPADLDSNVEQKCDIGKAWFENRNKEVPVAPTKEQVCSAYHNSHRLERLRRAARALFLSPEIAQVYLKLNAQIEKKLIAVRNDRNLHLDVGLQKAIMELLLSYNPLWLRIGLEAIYGIVLPLKSNSDIEGLTNFIIQRMFKNPFLKNRNSKSTAPNILAPAYVEALRKFTLKKFFILIFFLDQAKQKKLIPHDPCLFCRNATCKESREIIIRFTREIIAGIGDITKHLRPIGYVVSHKQSYLDEYKYAVHNLALDIRDGVRLTKVLEIILMKSGLLNQLRTPAISRLQKIHNVQVALNALKQANFEIVGDISAQDIADGHREKTLSLLWQLIHVLRAPLFEKAANVIQTWWRKKYEVIMEKRREEKIMRERLDRAASIIQHWWRRTQYNREVELQMRRVTHATIVFQKYCRMWVYRTRFMKQKTAVCKIEEWYKSMKKLQKAKKILEELKSQKEMLRQKSAVTLQSYVRRWLCRKQYNQTVRKVVMIQSRIRQFIARRRYLRLQKSVARIQQLYKGKLLMRKEMAVFAKKKKSAIVIQSYFRMTVQRKMFLKLKHSVNIIEERYIALLKMRSDMNKFNQLRQAVVSIQALVRGLKCRKEYLRKRKLIVELQLKLKAHFAMKRQRKIYLDVQHAVRTLQRHVRSYQVMKKTRQDFIMLKKYAKLIQQRYRAKQIMVLQRNTYLRLRNATITLQRRYRALMLMRRERTMFLSLKRSAVIIQTHYRAQQMMRQEKKKYDNLRAAVLCIQSRFRAQLKMRQEKARYQTLRKSCILIQNAYKAYILGKQQRHQFLAKKIAARIIQSWYRNNKKTKEIEFQYHKTKQASLTIQKVYRMYVIRKEYVKIKTATIQIQSYYRSYKEMKIRRQQFTQLKTATVTIQRFYRTYLDMKSHRNYFLQMKSAALIIQRCYRRYRLTKITRNKYVQLKTAVTFVQTKYRSILAMRSDRQRYLALKQSALNIQRRYRGLLAMRIQKQKYLQLQAAAKVIQARFRAQQLMKVERKHYLNMKRACITVQKIYRASQAAKKQRAQFLALKKATIVVQRRYRALLELRKQTIQLRIKRESAAVCIQKYFRRYVAYSWYQDYRKRVICIQQLWRSKLVTRLLRFEFLQTRRIIVKLQAVVRGYLVRKQILCKKEEILKNQENQKRDWAAKVIQAHYRGHKVRVAVNNDSRVTELRQRWRNGALKSTQESLKERNEEALEVIRNTSDIETVIQAFRSLELLSEVFPMTYNNNASSIVRYVYVYMSATNRSISSIELLKAAASLLVNLTRYRVTGPKIYKRDRISPILKFMWRYSNNETQLFCIFCTYLWLFSKYEEIRKDLTEFLNIPANKKMLATIKGNVERQKRMENNGRNPKSSTLTGKQSNLNYSVCSNSSKGKGFLLPALEPDYGIIREDKPRYFGDAYQAITCLFHTYNLHE